MRGIAHTGNVSSRQDPAWPAEETSFTIRRKCLSDDNDFKKQPSLRADFNSGGDDLSAMLDAQMEKIIDTWDIRADYARFKKHMLGINPVRSYTLNIGIGSGTHTTSPTSRYDSPFVHTS